MAGVGRLGRRVVRQLDEDDEGEEDDAPASAFDRPESELEAESDDEVSFDDEESFESCDAEEEPLDDVEESSFSLRRPLALAPWSFL